MTDNVKKEITQLRISVMGYGRISRQLGIPLSTVKSYCIRNNVPSKTRGQKLTALNWNTSPLPEFVYFL